MEVEFLIIVEQDETFCQSKENFITFLSADSSLSIDGSIITHSFDSSSDHSFSADIFIEAGNVANKNETFFHVILKNDLENAEDKLSSLAEKLKSIAKRINPESTVINTLWDDVGRAYAAKSYPLINKVENLMRKLISKFMLINVGMEWSQEEIHSDIFNKIKNSDVEDLYFNDLHKIDFILLSDVLFKKKSDLSKDKLIQILQKPALSQEDQDKMREFVPRSNWEKYFSTLMSHDPQSFKEKWKLLYKLRNHIAHNRSISKNDYAKISGLVRDVKLVINEAINKLDDITLKDEEREHIMDQVADSLGSSGWNGEFYVSFGYDRDVVSDGLSRGYIVAGGGRWYSRTLDMLEPGSRIWVNVPGAGYVGVGSVTTKTRRPVDEFTICNEDGEDIPIIQVSEPAASLRRAAETDLDTADYLVGVDWIKTVDLSNAVRESGFFGNQNSVARPRSPKWNHTVEILKERFGIQLS